MSWVLQFVIPGGDPTDGGVPTKYKYCDKRNGFVEDFRQARIFETEEDANTHFVCLRDFHHNKHAAQFLAGPMHLRLERRLYPVKLTEQPKKEIMRYCIYGGQGQWLDAYYQPTNEQADALTFEDFADAEKVLETLQDVKNIICRKMCVDWCDHLEDDFEIRQWNPKPIGALGGSVPYKLHGASGPAPNATPIPPIDSTSFTPREKKLYWPAITTGILIMLFPLARIQVAHTSPVTFLISVAGSMILGLLTILLFGRRYP